MKEGGHATRGSACLSSESQKYIKENALFHLQPLSSLDRLHSIHIGCRRITRRSVLQDIHWQVCSVVDNRDSRCCLIHECGRGRKGGPSTQSLSSSTRRATHCSANHRRRPLRRRPRLEVISLLNRCKAQSDEQPSSGEHLACSSPFLGKRELTPVCWWRLDCSRRRIAQSSTMSSPMSDRTLKTWASSGRC